MPLSSVEKKKNFIENLKRQGLFDEYKKKNAEYAKLRRLQLKDCVSKLTSVKQQRVIFENREKCRKRVELHRKRKKEQLTMDARLKDESSSLASIAFKTSYRTEGALRKAVAKTKRSLPNSPSKQKAVLTKMVEPLNAKDKADVVNNADTVKSEKRYKRLSAELIDAIRKFYQRDDISRPSPNVKDCKRFTNEVTAEKEFRQVRHLMFKLSEVHALFVEEYTAGKNLDEFKAPVQRTKFCSLRPKNVELISETPKQQCLCPYHSNFIQCWTAINKFVPGFPTYNKNSPEPLICQNPTEKCWFKVCDKCTVDIVSKKLKSYYPKTIQRKPVMWQQWIKDDVTNRTQNATVNGTVNDLFAYFMSIYPQFLIHSFVKREQSKSFVADHKSVDLEENVHHAVVQVDCAENFKCESQDEIQSAHFNQRQVSLFTTVMRHAKKTFSKVIASDNTKHSKETLIAFFYKIFSLMPKTVKLVKLWSDGPSSQFKNKFMAAIIKVFEKRFKKRIIWNYFATSHGKGAVDRLGATVKKIVRTRIDSRKDIVNCTSDFVRAFKKEKSTIDLIEMNDKEIDKINKTLGVVDIFNNAAPVKQIKSFHQVQFKCGKAVGFSMSKDGYDPSNSGLHENVKNPKKFY